MLKKPALLIITFFSLVFTSLSLMLLPVPAATAVQNNRAVPESGLTPPPVKEESTNNVRELRHNITTISEDVTVREDERLYGNITTVSGNINVYGEVFGNITTATGVVNIKNSAKIRGNITAGTGIINREPGADIQGNIVEGTKVEHGRFYPGNYAWEEHRPALAERVLNSVGTLLGLLAVTAIMLSIFPLNLETMRSALDVEPGRVVLVGILGWIVFPFVLLISLITIVGPLIIGLGAFVAVLAGTVIVALLLGEKLHEVFKWKNENKIVKALVGLATLWLASLLPVADAFILITCSVIGMGVVLVTKFGTGRPWFPPRKTAGAKPYKASSVPQLSSEISGPEPKGISKGGAENEPDQDQ